MLVLLRTCRVTRYLIARIRQLRIPADVRANFMKQTVYILISFYTIYSLIIQWKIYRSQLINRQQKIFNSIFLWIIPFLWGILVLSLIKPANFGVIAKVQRKTRQYKFSDNWHELTGFGGSANEHL